MLNRRHFLAAAAAALAHPAVAQAGYPDRPIHIIVGYAAGGGVDIVARLLGEPIKQALGQPVIVENRTGASAMIASNTVAKATPDGYTLLMAASGEVAINQHLFKEKMIYDVSRELTPVALIGIVPCVVVVASATPVHNCLLYTSDAADDLLCVDLGGRRIIKKKKKEFTQKPEES